jgi:uncharacterized protein (DUF302 family)
MLQVTSNRKLGGMEGALRQAAQRHGANIISIIHLGQLLREKQPKNAQDAIVFTICQPEISAALLTSDMRFAAFIPGRVAVYECDGAVILESLSSSEMCALVNRPDLESLAASLENTLHTIMDEAARTVAAAAHAAPLASSGLGATEEQVNFRRMVPQRIDCLGTKVEEIAGTGEHDAPGG